MKLFILASLFVAAAFGKAVPNVHKPAPAAVPQTVQIGLAGEVSSSVADPIVTFEVNNPHGIQNAVSFEMGPTDSYVVGPVVVAPETPSPSPVIVAPGIIGPGFEVEGPTVVSPVDVPIAAPGIIGPGFEVEGPAVVSPVDVPIAAPGIIGPGFEVENPAVVVPVDVPIAAPGIIGPGFEIPGLPSWPSWLPNWPVLDFTPVIVGTPIVTPPSSPGVIAPGFDVDHPTVVGESPAVVGVHPESPVVVDSPLGQLPVAPVVVSPVSVPEVAESKPEVNNFFVTIFNFFNGKPESSSSFTFPGQSLTDLFGKAAP